MSTNMIKSLTTADGPRLENSVTLVSEAPGTPPTIVDWQHRFKVVKMVSKEPFKRGRWLCMDFNDPPPSDVPGVSNIAELASDRPLSYFERDSSVGQSGGSTVAIDNKIEQAMDLVKSHLMFAVREEVDVLKEKIEELMEKITQLEYENSVLRAHASPETLSLLQQPAQQQAASAPQPQQSQATPQAQPPQLSNPQSSQPQSQPLLILETSNNNGNNAQE